MIGFQLILPSVISFNVPVHPGRESNDNSVPGLVLDPPGGTRRLGWLHEVLVARHHDLSQCFLSRPTEGGNDSLASLGDLLLFCLAMYASY